jgi:hypothetical protein
MFFAWSVMLTPSSAQYCPTGKWTSSSRDRTMSKTTYMPAPGGIARTGVSATDVRRLVGAADSLASLGSLEALRQRAADIVAELVDATLVAWNEVDLDGREIDAVISPPPDQFTAEKRDALGAAFIEHVADHPVIAYYRRTRDGRPYAISDFLSAAAFHRTGIYRHFYRHLGAEDQLSFVLPDASLIIGIALNRARRGFSARDRHVCNLLRPHVVQAYRSVEAATRMKRMTSTFQLAAAEGGLGFIRVDDQGQPYETSLSARSIMHRFFDLHSTPSLPDEISRWLARDRGRASPAELVLYRSDGRRLIVHRAPAPSGDLLLLSEQPKRPPDTRKLGLTAREAEVLALCEKGSRQSASRQRSASAHAQWTSTSNTRSTSSASGHECKPSSSSTTPAR